MAGNPASFTYPEVFIIESLSFEDEENGRFEGKILYDVLRLSGKNPKYYYFRTKDELVSLSQIFRDSDYRFLHISCHGSHASIFTTLHEIPYLEFGKIFENNLKNRRLFVSACEVGNPLFSTIVFGRNKGMYSIASPADKIEFSKALGLWAAFYTKIFSTDLSYMKNKVVKGAIQNLCNLFIVKFFWSWHNTFCKKYEEEIIHPVSISDISKAANWKRGGTS